MLGAQGQRHGLVWRPLVEDEATHGPDVGNGMGGKTMGGPMGRGQGFCHEEGIIRTRGIRRNSHSGDGEQTT